MTLQQPVLGLLHRQHCEALAAGLAQPLTLCAPGPGAESSCGRSWWLTAGLEPAQLNKQNQSALQSCCCQQLYFSKP